MTRINLVEHLAQPATTSAVMCGLTAVEATTDGFTTAMKPLVVDLDIKPDEEAPDHVHGSTSTGNSAISVAASGAGRFPACTSAMTA